MPIDDQKELQQDDYYDEHHGDDVCDYCGGDGGDPLSDYCLPCPHCGG